ncbi:hypothetical protein ACFCWB_33305 [Streptomyces bacillaris]|uniref:hypothetical protein n=1 Tax=Streptomyces bacillaris TaxID=68179 RepID=UPI0035DA7CC3
MSTPTRTFLLGRESPSDAWAEVQALATVLVRYRLADRYGVSRHKIHGRDAWGVYLTDRTPEAGPPPRLALAALRTFGLAA